MHHFSRKHAADNVSGTPGQPNRARKGVTPMKWFVVILIVLVVGVAALGYQRGWYTFSTDGDHSVGVSVDKDKLKVDEDKAKAKLEGLKDKMQEKAGEVKKDASAKPPSDDRK
jgi:hypothetical protein